MEPQPGDLPESGDGAGAAAEEPPRGAADGAGRPDVGDAQPGQPEEVPERPPAEGGDGQQPEAGIRFIGDEPEQDGRRAALAATVLLSKLPGWKMKGERQTARNVRLARNEFHQFATQSRRLERWDEKSQSFISQRQVAQFERSDWEVAAGRIRKI